MWSFSPRQLINTGTNFEFSKSNKVSGIFKNPGGELILYLNHLNEKNGQSKHLPEFSP